MKNSKKRVKGNKGITLIALVVTIIILIILATISVNMIFSENGLIATSKEAREHQANAIVSEQAELDRVAEDAANIIAGGNEAGENLPEITPDTPAGTGVKKTEKDWSNKVIAISDGSGNAIPLPNGFYYVGGNREEGLVISDEKGDTMDAVFPDSGNQFVWIPVTSDADFTRTLFNTTTGQTTTGLDTTKYQEPINGYPNEEAEFNTMKDQVLRYGGFYIGRYEAGDADSGTILRTKVTTDHTMVSKKGVAPYNYLPWGKSTSDADTAFAPALYNPDNVTTHGAVYLSKHMYDGKEQAESVVSTLCYGSQWDAMCRYIGDNYRTTPIKQQGPELTGSVSTDVSKNIYDLAGNCLEWTIETFTTSRRVYRGGSSYSSNPVSYRYNSNPDSSSDYYCLRLSLYIR